MSYRVILAGLFHETHTYLKGETTLADFTARRGVEMMLCQGDSSPLGGVLHSAITRLGWQLLPAVDYRATPSPTVADEVLEAWWADFMRYAEPELQAGVDGIFLVLHGAMVTHSHTDVEGEVLRRIRALPGASNVRLFGVFDLHANLSPAMASLADGLVGYRENPHTDARAAAQQAAGLLHWSLTTGLRPKMQLRQTGIIWPPTGTGTAVEPMLPLNQLARAMEEEEADLWALSVVPGFAYADTPDTGLSFLTCGLGDHTHCLEMLQELAHELEPLGHTVEPSAEALLSDLLQSGSDLAGLTVLVEPSDNIGAGAPGDGTGLLRAFLQHEVRNAALCLCDAAAVAALWPCTLGTEHALSLGGKGSGLDAGPVSLRVTLRSLHEGDFQLEDPHSHLASMCGDSFSMGRCAVVQYEGITLLLTSERTPPFDLGQWRSVGIEPSMFSFMGVKAAVAHRQAYDPIAARMLWVDTPGPVAVT
jgi:microcystin degradation protein MlrC